MAKQKFSGQENIVLFNDSGYQNDLEIPYFKAITDIEKTPPRFRTE
jgi:hypothetical protein